MGAQKNATYKVHNGTDFDEINFKTILEQVKFPDGTSLLEFFNNGGKINGDIELPPGKKFKSKMNDGRNVNIAYMQNNGAVTYGDELNPTFLVGATRPGVWENNASNPIVCSKDYITNASVNGYMKLPNRIIIQWGAIQVTGGVNGVEVILPINFSTNYRLTATPVDLALGTTPITTWITGKSNNQFWIRASSNCSVQWIAVGY